MPVHHAPQEIEVDVAIVGFGPVGQALAALLGRAGHSVLAVERFAEIYRLPRAVHLDHEIMRLLQGLGSRTTWQARCCPSATTTGSAPTGSR